MTIKKTAIFFVLVLILFLLVFLSQSIKAQGTNCASAGQQGDVHGKQCCSGLTSVPLNKVPVNGACLSEYPPYGTQFLCIKRYDDICGAGENACNSPQDCLTGIQAPVVTCRSNLDCPVCSCLKGSICNCPQCINGKCVKVTSPQTMCGNGICEGDENNTHRVCTTTPNSVCFDVKNCPKDCSATVNSASAPSSTETDKNLINKILQLIDQLKSLIYSLFSR